MSKTATREKRARTGGMVVTAFPLASQAGAEMLKQGGNAIDAAAAAAWALAVCEPGNSGIGGQSIVLIHQANGATRILDGHSRAPAGVSLEQVDYDQQRAGHTACVVPTTPAVLEQIQHRWGRLRPEQVLAPAIRLAEDGYAMTPLQHSQLTWCLEGLSASELGRSVFLHQGQPYPVGKLFRQPQLGRALQRIARYGAEDFYHGEIARAMVEDMERNGGFLSAEDLAEVSPIERDPFILELGVGRVMTAPPPGGGFMLFTGLSILEELRERIDLTSDIRTWYEMLGEATHACFAERERLPSKLSDFPRERLLEIIRERAVIVASDVSRGVIPPPRHSDPEKGGETTHLCAVDDEGNVVSLTQSLQALYGARAGCMEHGILYNNYLMTCPRDPHPHQLGSRSQPRSNSAPSILFFSQDDQARALDAPYLTFGATGSRRSVSASLFTLSGILDRKLTLPEALAVPRLHVQLTRDAWLEDSDLTETLLERLTPKLGNIELRDRLSYGMGCAQAIHRQVDGTMIGAADPRREGTAERVEA